MFTTTLSTIIRLSLFTVFAMPLAAARAADDGPSIPGNATADAAPKPDEAAKPDEAKPGESKPADAPKPDEAKPDAKPEPEKLFTEGRDALFQGKFDEAVELLTKAVAAEPAKTSYRLHLARAFRYAGKQDEAIANLEQILETAPDHVEAGQALAEVYSAAQKWKEVVRTLEPLLKYRHDYPTYHMLAEAHYNLDEKDKARKAFEEAIRLNPQSGADHYQLGNLYLGANSFARAADAYRAALRLGLDSPVLRYKLGSAYFNLRNYFGSVSQQTIRSGEVGTISGTWYLIEAVPGQKDVFRCAPEASAIYQVAKALADGIEDRPDIHVLRATIYLNARRYAQAHEMFDKIGPTVPDDDKALFHYYHAQAAFGMGNYDRYLELLQKAIELDPTAYRSTLVDAYVAVADQYNQTGQVDLYIDYLRKAVSESPQTASLHLKLANAYEESQRPALALVEWRMVLDLEPDHPQRMRLLNLIAKHQKAPAKP